MFCRRLVPCQKVKKADLIKLPQISIVYQLIDCFYGNYFQSWGVEQKEITPKKTYPAKKLQTSIISYINSGDLRKPPLLFQIYSVKCIEEIWEKFKQIEKLQLLQYIRLKCIASGDIICSFHPKKQVSQIFILLKGTIEYRINIDNNRRVFQYICRPGQILFQPNQNIPLDFKQFSLVATSDCYLLKFPYDSLLRQYLWEKKMRKISQLLTTLSGYKQLNNEQIQFSKLIPYFSDCHNRKNQTILSQTQSGYLCYISQGEIEIIKQSSKIKPISLISMGPGQIYIHNANQTENEKNYIKCKSQTSLVYVIPQCIINLLGSVAFEECMKWKSKTAMSLHSRIFSKNEKILVDPIKFIRDKNKKKIKNHRKSKSYSRKSAPTWDLIGHFANQMKKSPSVHALRSDKQYAKSAHITKRTHFDQQNISSLQKLKKITEQETSPETYQEQNIKLTNSFKPKLKNSLQMQSKLLKTLPTKLVTNMKKETRNKLIKRTKFKLLRYASGHNLYGLDDYL